MSLVTEHCLPYPAVSINYCLGLQCHPVFLSGNYQGMRTTALLLYNFGTKAIQREIIFGCFFLSTCPDIKYVVLGQQRVEEASWDPEPDQKAGRLARFGLPRCKGVDCLDGRHEHWNAVGHGGQDGPQCFRQDIARHPPVWSRGGRFIRSIQAQTWKAVV